jgi:two-component system NtrC family sensor kinase
VLPEYLNRVAEILVREQTEFLAEIVLVAEHIEHIKRIVAMQQSYAKVSGLKENLSVAELVEDALRMNVAALERHKIQLVRDFDQAMPNVCVDKHKVLQILINLIRNAKHAMDHEEGREKRLLIQVTQNDPKIVKICIIDNGIGIAPENLTKIFTHGFTTKPDGHGFGLHSGANAAREMGGNLSVHSEGKGKGATFILDLPVAGTTLIKNEFN